MNDHPTFDGLRAVFRPRVVAPLASDRHPMECASDAAAEDAARWAAMEWAELSGVGVEVRERKVEQ